MSDDDVNPDEEFECPECKNSAVLKEWVFVEETFEDVIFQCPYCKIRVTSDSMRSV